MDHLPIDFCRGNDIRSKDVGVPVDRFTSWRNRDKRGDSCVTVRNAVSGVVAGGWSCVHICSVAVRQLVGLEQIRQNIGVANKEHGVLYPAALPDFCRLDVTGAAESWVRWWWVAQWHLSDTDSSTQKVLSHPTTNLVVEAGGVVFAGPTTQVSTRLLVGDGWAVGAALKPTAWESVARLSGMPGTLSEAVNCQLELVVPDLQAAVAAAMTSVSAHSVGGPLAFSDRAHAAANVFSEWISQSWLQPSAASVLATKLVELAAEGVSAQSVEGLADLLGVSARSLQRAAASHIGLPPLVVLNRARIQEAAQRIRQDPEVALAQVGTDLGYSDHAHLTRDFRRHLGKTPQSYRRELTGQVRDSSAN